MAQVSGSLAVAQGSPFSSSSCAHLHKTSPPRQLGRASVLSMRLTWPVTSALGAVFRSKLYSKPHVITKAAFHYSVNSSGLEDDPGSTFLCDDEHKILSLHTHKIMPALSTSQDYRAQSARAQREIILKTVQTEVGVRGGGSSRDPPLPRSSTQPAALPTPAAEPVPQRSCSSSELPPTTHV